MGFLPFPLSKGYRKSDLRNAKITARALRTQTLYSGHSEDMALLLPGTQLLAWENSSIPSLTHLELWGLIH